MADASSLPEVAKPAVPETSNAPATHKKPDLSGLNLGSLAEIVQPDDQSRGVETWSGSKKKSAVFNEGKDGKRYAVPFKLRAGGQENSLAISTSSKDPQKILFETDVKKLTQEGRQTIKTVTLHQEGDKLFIAGQEVDLTKGNAAIKITPEVTVVVTGFDLATREVILFKRVEPQAEADVRKRLEAFQNQKPWPEDMSKRSDLGPNTPVFYEPKEDTKDIPVYEDEREGTYDDLHGIQQEQGSTRDKAEGERNDDDDTKVSDTTQPEKEKQDLDDSRDKTKKKDGKRPKRPKQPRVTEPKSSVSETSQPITNESNTQVSATYSEEPSPPKPPQTEEIDESYSVPGSVKEAFYQDRVDDANAPRLTDIQVAREAKQKGELYGHQKIVDNMDVVDATLLNPDFQAFFPKKPQEADGAYRRRLLDNLSTRLRFHGDYAAKKDPAYLWMQGNLKDAQGTFQHQDEILMATEALSAIEIKTANDAKEKAYKQKMFNLNQQAGRRSVLSAVSLTEDERYPTGDYLKYLTVTEGEEGKLHVSKEKMAAADLAAFEMVGTVLGDVEDPTLGRKPDGKGYTYNEQFKYLSSQATDTTRPQEDRDNASRRLVALREKFYINTLDILKHRHDNNPYRPDQESSSFQHQAFERLYSESGLDLSHKSPQEAFTTLMTAYQQSYESYHGRKPTPRQLERFNAILDAQHSGIPQDIIELSMKGAELTRRRTEELPKPPKLDKVPTRIYRKTFMDKGVYRGPVTEVEEETPVIITPPTEEGEGVTPAPIEGEGETQEDLENPEGAPVEGKEGKPDDTETPGPAPVDQTEPTKKPLETEFYEGVGYLDKQRRVQNMLQITDHLFSEDLRSDTKSNWYKLRDKALGWSYRIPLLGGVIRGLVHPVQYMWQQGLARSVFEQQHVRYQADSQAIIRNIAPPGVPIEFTQELADRALDEGRRLKNEAGAGKKLWWKFTDTLKGVTGLSQTSEQQMAKKWLADELAKPADQWVDELKQTESRSLSEQTNLGERYAQWDRSLTLEQSNLFGGKISTEAGETRHELSEELRKPFNERMKGFIAEYATGQITEKQLVEKVNAYLLGDLKTELVRVNPDLAKELDTKEVGSNILNLAYKVTGKEVGPDGQVLVVEADRWQRYQTEVGESEKTKWEEVQVNLLFGKAEFGRVRGHKELGFLSEILAEKLAERQGLSEKSQASAVAYAKDALTNAAFFGAGYWGGAMAMSLLGMPKNIALRAMAGLGGIAGGTALKETGISIPWLKHFEFELFGKKVAPFRIKGRYLKEVEQLSREAARGRLTPERAKIRQEMEKLLVPRLKVNEILAGDGYGNHGIEAWVYKEGNLTDVEAKQLLIQLSEIRARMRLSDLSQTRSMDYKTQNYFEFTEGRENEQNQRLTAALEQGLVKIIKSGHGDLLGAATNFDKYDQLVALSEAQLRYSSADSKGMKGWLVKEKGLTTQEADNWINAVLPNIDLRIDKDNSLRAKNSLLLKYTLKRGATMAARAALTGLATEELRDFTQDWAHGGAGEYFQEWKDVINHQKIPLELDQNGALVADLTLAQKFTLAGHNMIENQSLASTRVVPIDGINLRLGGNFEYQQTIINGQHYDGIVNIWNGHVTDMSGIKLDHYDYNGDGQAELVMRDAASGQIRVLPGLDPGQSLAKQFDQNGIKLVEDPSLNQPGAEQPINIFQGGNLTDHTINVNGQEVHVNLPANCQILDKDNNGDFEIYGTVNGVAGTEIANHIVVNSNGTVDFSHVTFNPQFDGHVNLGSSLTSHEMTSGAEIWNKAEDFRVVHANSENAVPMTNSVIPALHPVEGHELGVRFQFPESAVHNPNFVGRIDFLHDAATDNRVGILLQVPHYGPSGSDVGIFVPAHFDSASHAYVVDFDPTDTLTKIQLPHGETITMAELADKFLNEDKLSGHHLGPLGSEMTLEGREFFNLANPDGVMAHQGRILGGYIDEQSKNYTYENFDALGHVSANGGAFIATHAVHGSNPVDLSEGPVPTSIPEIKIDDLTRTDHLINLGYRMDGPFRPTFEPGPPIPMRENIEKSTKGEGTVTPPVQVAQTTPAPVTPPSPVAPAPVAPETEGISPQDMELYNRIDEAIKKHHAIRLNEKERYDQIKKRIEERARAEAESNLTPLAQEKNRELTSDESQRIDRMTELAKKVLESTGKSGKKYSDEIYDRLLAETNADPDQLRQYIDQSLNSNLEKDNNVVLGSGKNVRVRDMNDVSYQEDLDQALNRLRLICIQRDFKTPEDLKNFYLKKLSEKTIVQMAITDPAKRNPALHHMASLATVMKLADEGKLDLSVPAVEEPKKTEGFDQEKINGLLTKLNERHPSGPGGHGRIGIEVEISPEDVEQIRQLTEATQARFDEVIVTNTHYQKLQELIKTHLDPSKQTPDHIKGVEIAMAFGGFIREDSAVTEPTEKINPDDGTTILLVPKETYELFKIWNKINTLNDYLNKTKPVYDKGSFSETLSQDLQSLLTFLEKNKKA